MSKKLRKTCCEKYKKGKKACSSCPTMALLTKRGRRKLLKKYHKKK